MRVNCGHKLEELNVLYLSSNWISLKPLILHLLLMNKVIAIAVDRDLLFMLKTHYFWENIQPAKIRDTNFLHTHTQKMVKGMF